jgi:hypothetical protein
MPAVIPSGEPLTDRCVIAPEVVIRPMLLVPDSVNQSAWSGPTVISTGRDPAGRPNSVIAPPSVIRPIRFPFSSVNHTLPSGPAVIPAGWQVLPGGAGDGAAEQGFVSGNVWPAAAPEVTRQMKSAVAAANSERNPIRITLTS